MSTKASPAPSGDRDNVSSSADDEGEEETPVESLVTGRVKRATAGNRLSSLLEKEGDDDLELLFAENEEEEDIEFEEDEDASDVQLDSSSDEEDDGPAKAGDDLAGEKELQKQDKLERQKKRKAQEAFKRPGALRKRVKIDPSATPTPRPKKKSERVSWMHTEADAPTRLSSRKQTVQNREVTHQKLAIGEHTRLNTLHQMEEARKRKDAMKPKALTQAERMEEAARMERKNAKSLNRWEESEKKRAEEQKAKLEALHNRQLTGPVISWWSGLARWINGKIGQLGVREIREAGHVEKSTEAGDSKSNSNVERSVETVANGATDQDTVMSGGLRSGYVNEVSQRSEVQHGHQLSIPQQITFTPPQGPYGFLDGIHAYAALPIQQQQAEFTGTADSDSLPQSSFQPFPPRPPDQRPHMPIPEKTMTPEIEFTSRTLVALKNIDANAAKLPEMQSHVFQKKRSSKVPS
ncbi:hypothetical protein MMC28_002459 [Mycoblastus sanguinarius]|nr:hypothetical protein [Mycoblastus sanguinarius]